MSDRAQKRRTMIVASVVVVALLGAIGYTIYSTISGGTGLEYFKEVDQALDDLPHLKGKTIRLHGNVVAGTIQKKPKSLQYRFGMFHNRRWVEVIYRGLVPDTFKDCAEVVVKGRFAKDGRSFTARKITAKCPSKYDEKQRTFGCGEALKPQVVAFRKQR